MNNTDLFYLKQKLESIDWNADFEKADKENYEALDSLCEYIEKELSNNLLRLPIPKMGSVP